MSALHGLSERFFAPVPAERLAALRLLTGTFACVYLLVRAPVLADFSRMAAERFEPVGAARVLSAPVPNALATALWAACVLGSVAFALGYRFRWSGPLFAALLLWVTSYRTSWGMLFHTDNMLVLHVLVLGSCPAGAALSLDARAGRSSPRVDAAHAGFGWPIRLLCALTALAYFIAGVAKLKASGLAWATGDILRNYIAYDSVRKAALGSVHSPLGAWLVQYAWPFPVIGALTLVVELGAPLALLGPRVGRAWVLGVWGFHAGVLATMAIAFPYPLSGVAFASFFLAERVFAWRPLSPLARWLGGTEAG